MSESRILEASHSIVPMVITQLECHLSSMKATAKDHRLFIHHLHHSTCHLPCNFACFYSSLVIFIRIPIPQKTTPTKHIRIPVHKMGFHVTSHDKLYKPQTGLAMNSQLYWKVLPNLDMHKCQLHPLIKRQQANSSVCNCNGIYGKRDEIIDFMVTTF